MSEVLPREKREIATNVGAEIMAIMIVIEVGGLGSLKLCAEKEFIYRSESLAAQNQQSRYQAIDGIFCPGWAPPMPVQIRTFA
jgi:hypothetical protein